MPPTCGATPRLLQGSGATVDPMTDLYFEKPSISRRTLAAIGVAGALGLGFLAGAITSAGPSSAQTPPSSSSDSGSSSTTPPDSGSQTPAPHHHGGGHCPNMGGDSGSSGSGSSSSDGTNSGASYNA